MRSRIIILLVFISIAAFVSAQCPINSLGQNPSTAFPVCGTNTFDQAQVNLCGGKGIPNPKCNTNLLTDINPYWYKFTCFEAGTLGFTIQPKSDVSDYDWQVFDITGRSPDVVYSDKSISIASNWSQYFGNTGTTNTASSIFECEGPTPQFSKMPVLIKGHEYLLLVSHFSNTQAGYKLVFSGGTASITDTTKPGLRTLEASCNGKTLGIKLNKKMKCSSVADNGSDFYLVSGLSKVIAATGINCHGGFDMDSISLTLETQLPPGTYTIKVKKGTDGNTILDDCDQPVSEGDSVSLVLKAAEPTPMDSLQIAVCKPEFINLVFSNPILCNTIAADGSDFIITGPSPVNITGAAGSCINGETRNIILQLDKVLTRAGTYTLTLKKGTDGNTVFNVCDKETPAGSSLAFQVHDTVSAAIDYVVASSCIDDTLRLSNKGFININAWKWTLDDGSAASTRQLQRIYSSGQKTFKLVVSNGYCIDSASTTINFDKNRLNAAFEASAFVCPLDTAYFSDASTGPVTEWYWNFGNGYSSTLQEPPFQFYPVQIALQHFTTTLVIKDANGCSDTASKIIEVPGNCYIAVPTAFTPNNDGLNDYLYPLSAYKAEHLSFKVYNRYGQLVWETTDWTRKWDGRFKGELQAAGTYVWYLNYTDGETGKKVELKGTTILIR